MIEYYRATTRNKLLIYAKIEMNFKGMMCRGKIF